MNPIKVVVHGASGRMGREVVAGLSREPGIQIVGAVDLLVERALTLPDGASVPFSDNLQEILSSTKPDVLVDFSRAQPAMSAARTAAAKKVHLVIGTTGLSADDLAEIGRLATSNKIGAVVASNFALGAILLIHMAKIAAKYFDYAEIIELHHHLKADAPSGTSLSTARAMAQARGKPFSYPSAQKAPAASRGETVEGITLHSVRLPGLMAHQEVLFGCPGQTLSIRHDTISRECYIPGIALAVREVINRQGLINGLDTLLGL